MRTELIIETAQRLSMAQDIEGVTRIVRGVARQLTGADGATFVLRDGDQCHYVDEDAISPLWKGKRFSMKDCVSGWVMLNKKQAVIPDIHNDERIPADVYLTTFVKSMVMVPIRKMNPMGAIGNYWAHFHLPTDEEVASLQALADVTSISIENIEIKDQLKGKLHERTQMLELLQKQKRQLEEFTHIIAHNLRAPLSNLLMLSEMIRESREFEDKLELLEKQGPVIQYLYETFENIIDSIHISIDFNIVSDYVDLEDCLKTSTQLLQAEIIESGAKITTDFSKAKRAFFPKKYIDSIFFNILSNALKYRSDKRSPHISVKSYKKNGWIHLEFSDNGLGIDLKKYGDKLFGLRKTFHDHPNAKGFGLFITKAQVEAMDGTIDVKSTPDEGSVFTIKLNKNR